MRTALLCLASLLLLTSCDKPDKLDTPPADIRRICVSIPPLISVVKAVAGDGVTVTALMSEKDDPHTFSPSPQAIASLRDADLFLTIGVDYEKALAGKVSRMFPELSVVDVSRGLNRCAIAAHDHHEGEHEGHDEQADTLSDPHVWLSIPNLMVIADNVRAAVIRAAPARTDMVTARCETYKYVLQTQHKAFAEQLKGLENRRFCVYHPVFGYFARDYDLHQATVEIDGKAPSPRQLRDLFEQASKEKIRVVFVQPQFNEGPAQTIAAKIGGRVVRVNPLDEDPANVISAAVAALIKAQ